MTTMLTTTNYNDVFVYSEMQYKEDNDIALKNSKRFVCGSIYEGHNAKPFTKLININDLNAMTIQYPDTKIVARGNKSKVKYTKPFTELNI